MYSPSVNVVLFGPRSLMVWHEERCRTRYSALGFRSQLMTRLENQFPAISRERVGSGTGETWSAQIWLEATDLRNGFETALTLVEGATGLPSTGVEIFHWNTFDQRVENL